MSAIITPHRSSAFLPATISAPVRPNLDMVRAVIEHAIDAGFSTTMEPVSRGRGDTMRHGVRISNTVGAAVIFAAAIEPIGRVVIEKGVSGMPGVKIADPLYSALSAPMYQVNLMGVDDDVWGKLTPRAIARSSFLRSAVMLFKADDDIHDFLSGVYGHLSVDPRIRSAMRGIPEDLSLHKLSSFDAIAKEVGAAVMDMGALVLLDGAPRRFASKLAEAAVGLFRKSPMMDPIVISHTDMDAPRPLQEMVIKVERGQRGKWSLKNLHDVSLVFRDPEYSRNSYDQMYIVRSRNFFKRLMSWNRAFMLYQEYPGAHPTVLMSNVEDPRGHRSSHNTIRHGLLCMFGDSTPISSIMQGELERGYLRPADGGGYEIYSLSGANLFGSDGRPSSRAETVRQTFALLLGVDVGLSNDS